MSKQLSRGFGGASLEAMKERPSKLRLAARLFTHDKKIRGNGRKPEAELAESEVKGYKRKF